MYTLRYLFRVIGIIIVWIVNLPIYLYLLLKAKTKGEPLPPPRRIFFIPPSVDEWVSVIGLCAFILFIILGVTIQVAKN